MYLKLHGDHRPLALKTDIIKKRQRTPSTTSKKAQKKNHIQRSASSSMLSNMNIQPPTQQLFTPQLSNPTSPANALPSLNEMDVASVLTHPEMFNTNLYRRPDPVEYMTYPVDQYSYQPTQPFVMRPVQQPQQPASPTSAEYYSNMYWNHQ